MSGLSRQMLAWMSGHVFCAPLSPPNLRLSDVPESLLAVDRKPQELQRIPPIFLLLCAAFLSFCFGFRWSFLLKMAWIFIRILTAMGVTDLLT